MRMQERNDVSGTASARKHERGRFGLRLCLSLATLQSLSRTRSQRQTALCIRRLALANMDDSVRALRSHRQIYVGPFQREKFAIRTHSGINSEDGCITEIRGPFRQVQRLF